jgi:NADPH-dependent curcumin reductase CurA
MIAREIHSAAQVVGAPSLGDFVYPQTVIKGGVEDVPQAFLSLLQGAYRGNVSARLS